MPITDDQRAVLDMLLTGGQSYEDMDDLFGLDEGETRKRARAALTEIGGTDPDSNVGLTDYLIGQADPIGRADAVRHLRQDSTDAELASEIVTELDQMFPGADLPTIQVPSAGTSRFMGRSPAPAKKKPEREPEREREREPEQPAGEPQPSTARTSLTFEQTRLMAGLGAGALVLIVVVLAVAGVFSGGDDEPAPTPDETAATDGADPSSPLPGGDEEITRVPLAPVNGGDAAGAAIVGIATGDQPYLELQIENLQNPPQDQTYIAWFMFDEDSGYPLAEPIVPQQGSYENRIAIPQAVAEPISTARAIEISLSDPADIQSAIEDAVEANSFQIEVPGQAILRGDVPQQPTGGGGGDQQAPGEGQPQDPTAP